MKKRVTQFLFLLVAIIIIIEFSPTVSVPKIEAQSAGDSYITGYAWSDNIGWIKFDPVYGGVRINSSGSVYGYAWSSIGWISFNSADVAGCPSGSCSPYFDLATRKFSGYARALSHADNWDGFISLGGSNYGLTVGYSGVQDYSLFSMSYSALGSNKASSVSSLTINNVNTGTTENDILVVAVQTERTPCLPSYVSFGSPQIQLTKAVEKMIGTGTASNCTQIFYLINPTGTGPVNVLFSANQNSITAQAVKVNNAINLLGTATGSWTNVNYNQTKSVSLAVPNGAIVFNSTVFDNEAVLVQTGSNGGTKIYGGEGASTEYGLSYMYGPSSATSWKNTSIYSAARMASAVASFRGLYAIRYPSSGSAWGSDIVGWIQPYNLEIIDPVEIGVGGSTLSASCAPMSPTAYVGDTVTWSVGASGGTGTYTYQWAGGSTSQTATQVYNSVDSYSTSTIVTSGSESVNVLCSSVNVTDFVATCTYQDNGTVTVNEGATAVFLKMVDGVCSQIARVCTEDINRNGYWSGDSSYTIFGSCPVTKTAPIVDIKVKLNGGSTYTGEDEEGGSLPVVAGSNVVIGWDIGGSPDTCTVTDGLNGSATSSGSAIINGVNETKLYSISCIGGPDGDDVDTDYVRIIIPSVKEF